MNEVLEAQQQVSCSSLSILTCKPQERAAMPPLRILLALLCTAIASLLQAQPLTLAYSEIEAFPIQMGNSNQVTEPPGLAVDLLREVAKQLNLELTLLRYPNNRVLKELADNRIDGAFCYSFNPERAAIARYPMQGGLIDHNARITTIAYHLYTRPNDPLMWDGTQLSQLNDAIGLNAGFSILNELNVLGVPVEETVGNPQNLRKLALGRIQAFAGQDITTDPLIASGKYGAFRKLPVPLSTKDYFLLLSNDFVASQPELANALWQTIGKLRSSVMEANQSRYHEP